MTTTVLVTGVGGGVGQGIIKSLRLIPDLELRVIAADASRLSAGLYAADAACLVPRSSSPDYIPEMVEILRKSAVDYYFPGTDTELEVCASAAEHIRSVTGTDVVVSPVETVRVAADKYATYRFLADHDLPAPMTYLPSEVHPDRLAYPVIVKPRHGARSQGVREVASADELVEVLNGRSDLIVQELVGTADSEFTCTVIGDTAAGDLGPFLLQRWLRDGDTYRAQPVQDDDIAHYVADVASALPIYGPCNFQLRRGDDGPRLFEINARCSGTTPLWAQLGFNPVEAFLKQGLGVAYEPAVRYEATVLRYWAEMIVSHEQVAAVDVGTVAPARRLVPPHPL